MSVSFTRLPLVAVATVLAPIATSAHAQDRAPELGGVTVTDTAIDEHVDRRRSVPPNFKA